jgi:hypothetical protein
MIVCVNGWSSPWITAGVGALFILSGLVTVRWPNAPAVIAEARPRPVPAIPGWCTAEADPLQAHALKVRAERRGAYLSMASGVAFLLLAGVQHLQHS